MSIVLFVNSVNKLFSRKVEKGIALSEFWEYNKDVPEGAKKKEVAKMKNVNRLTYEQRMEIVDAYTTNGVFEAMTLIDKMCGVDHSKVDYNVSEYWEYLDTREAFMFGLIAANNVYNIRY